MRHLKFLMILILSLMILSRMVVIQIRAFPVSIDYRSLVAYAQAIEFIDKNSGVCRVEKSLESSVWKIFGDPEFRSKEKFSWFRVPVANALVWLSCKLGFDADYFLTGLNLVLFGMDVFFMFLLSRILTGSWFFGLVASLVVLSRGRLVATMGEISLLHMQSVVFNFAALSLAHHIRTASLLSGFTFIAGALTLIAFDKSWISISISLILLWVIWVLKWRFLKFGIFKRSSKHSSLGFPAKKNILKKMFGRRARTIKQWRRYLGVQYSETRSLGQRGLERGGLFKTITMPFAFWILNKTRMRQLLLFLSMFVIVSLSLVWIAYPVWWLEFGLDGGASHAISWKRFESMLFSVSWSHIWFKSLWGAFDMHWMVSVFLIGLACFQTPVQGLQAFFEYAWWFVVTSMIGVITMYFADTLDAILLKDLLVIENYFYLSHAWLRIPQYLRVYEPLVLSLGVCALVNLLSLLDEAS